MIDLRLGDCLKVLKTLPSESVDSIVSDPPYELGFMGKKWDNTGIAYNIDLWKECLRVLKPGGHLLAFGGTRTYHRMAVAIEDAGFEVRDMLEWIYASGFPKSLNVGKAVDKICGETGRELKFVEWFRTTGLKQKETNEIIGKNDVGSHYLRKDQPAIPTAELWAKLRPHIKIEIPKWVDELVERIEREREVVGEYIAPDGKPYSARQPKQWTPQFSDCKIENAPAPKLTKGNSEWEGFGTALKPAHEPIILARKPLSEKTIVENVLKHGTGAIDIDGTRIPTSGKDLEILEAKASKEFTGVKPFGENEGKGSALKPNEQGRFPANIICTDDALNDNQITKSGSRPGQKGKALIGSENGETRQIIENAYGDSGSKSRYFDIDVWAEKYGLLQFPKASKRERNKGLDDFPKVQRGLGRNGVGENKSGGISAPQSNSHPTVKPVHLMSWLIRLVSKSGDIVLDPFMGSGTTGVSCKRLGRNFIGIELNPGYLKLAEKRINQIEEDMFVGGKI